MSRVTHNVESFFHFFLNRLRVKLALRGFTAAHYIRNGNIFAAAKRKQLFGGRKFHTVTS